MIALNYRSIFQSLLVTSFIFGTIGCSIIPSAGEPTINYVLLPNSFSGSGEEGRENSCVGPNKSAPVVLIAPTDASSYVGGTRIPFITGDKVGFYQFAVWVEPLAERFNLLLQKKLECKGIVSSALRALDWARSDYILKTEIQRLEHNTSARPGFVTLHLRAELIESSLEKSFRSKEIEVNQRVESYDAEGAVEAMNGVVSNALDLLSNWLQLQLTAK